MIHQHELQPPGNAKGHTALFLNKRYTREELELHIVREVVEGHPDLSAFLSAFHPASTEQFLAHNANAKIDVIIEFSHLLDLADESILLYKICC